MIRPTEVAEMTGLSVAALAQLRYKGKGPRYYKPAPHQVVYKPAE
ncbi:helix-turn-helix transcriptional regulator [Leifsonia sp. L25]